IIQAGSYTESLTLNKAISLTGVSSDTVILHAEPNNRVLTVTGAVIDHQVVISGLTFTGGNLGTSNSCPDCGGGILITGTARPLIQSVILDRNKADFGAAIYSHNNSPLELSQVKVISNGLYAITAEAPLTISHSSFSGNSFGVLAYETLSVNESQFVNDAGIFALAPAAVYKSYFENATISTTAHILVTGSQFISSSYTALRANSATVEHSYFAHAYIEDYPFRPWQEGGAIYTADALTLTHSTVIDNQADSGGGVFSVGDIRVVSSYFEGNEGEGIISDKGNILISDTQIINNIDGFGAVATLHNPSSPTEVHIIDSLISGTIDGNGVWIGSPMWITNSQIVYSEGSGVLAANDVHIAKSTIAHNGNSQYGGLGLYITNGDAYIAESDISYNGNTDGVGGLYIQGNVTVDRSTFLGNIMNGFHTDMGGGGGVKSDGYVTVTNSLFQENSCVNGCYGGSIYAKKGLTISNTEFISNSAEHFGGAAFTHGTAYITNSTFISNAAVNGAGGVMYASEAYIANSRFIANRGLIIPGILMGDGTVLNSLFLNNDVFDIGSE
ncbi:MAG: hypothetical protein KDE51_25585, partial [Anaerolineales bacterium]|nr:hypothetical protein [Anaerolineales bacterium]